MKKLMFALLAVVLLLPSVASAKGEPNFVIGSSWVVFTGCQGFPSQGGGIGPQTCYLDFVRVLSKKENDHYKVEDLRWGGEYYTRLQDAYAKRPMTEADHKGLAAEKAQQELLQQLHQLQQSLPPNHAEDL